MATVNFYLNTKENSKGKKLLLVYFRYKKSQVVISTNELIIPAHWDRNNQRATSKHRGYSSFNEILRKYRGKLNEAYNERKLHGLSLLPADLKPVFERIINQNLPTADTESKKELSLVNFIDTQLERIKNSKNANTLKTYRRSRDILVSFEKEVFKRELLFTDIDLDFYLDWKDFVITKFNFQNNSINKHTGILKLFMGEANDRGLHENIFYTKKQFSTPREDVYHIYLTTSEIITLINIDLSENDRLEKVRDLFIIGCRTGLRFSDLANLREENVSPNLEYLKITKTIKTNISLEIPIHPDTKRIFEKYKKQTGSYIPPSISNQKMNKYLKEIGKLAGLDEEISQVIKVGNSRKQVKFPKYDLITCHTARRSFATNEYLADTPIYEIMAVTGHKSEKAFKSYVKVDQQQLSRRLGKRW